ncbi:MAG: hypothetical protein NXI27_31795, partial [Alphaproteobacteria bacterium]|nr:hypothetical protein [Alphaproteobacteria bacterium]
MRQSGIFPRASGKRFKTWIFALTMALLLLANGTTFWFARSSMIELAEFNNIARQLESHIGFNGLIHHFKNAVLRPGEAEYIERAEEAAASATALSAELSRRGEALGLEDSERLLEPVREMIRQYEARLLLVERGPDRGLRVQEIDQTVRYDDSHAIQALGDLSTAIKNKFLSTQTLVSSVAVGLNFGTLALFVVLTLAAAMRRETWLRER